MRNVLFLARGGVIDGHQRQVLYLATGLKAAGTSVIVALDEKGPLQEELAAAGLESHVLRQSTWRRLGHGFHRYLDAYRIARLAAATSTQIVHAHDVWRGGIRALCRSAPRHSLHRSRQGTDDQT